MQSNYYEDKGIKKDATENYQRLELTTADPKRLIILCYERAINSMKLAIEYFEAGNFEAKAKEIQKVQDIIGALRTALDFRNGGEVALNLDSLYSFMSRHLIEADLKKDIGAFKAIVHMLEEIETAWKEIFYGPYNENIDYSQTLHTTLKSATAEKRAWVG